MKDKGITVIVPTTGRETLQATIDSIAPQLTEADAVVVIFDGASHQTQRLVVETAKIYPGPDWAFIAEFGGHWGHPNRNHVLDNHVNTSHVWTIDDDDIAMPWALDAMRRHMDDPWTVFKMTFGEGHFARGVTCWRQPALTPGDIGTPMMFAPLCNARFGYEYMGDWHYAKSLRDELGDPVFAEDLVALIRPVVTE